MTLRSVVKWAGGKRRLAEQLASRMPPGTFRTYVEPFAGGAALFFHLAAEPTLRFERAVLCDKNEDLVALYRAITNDLETLIALAKEHQREHLALDRKRRADHYYRVRAQPTTGMSEAERGARLLFLNRTCFNGLWRENASGRFNVPFGRYENPKIADSKTLRAARRALDRARAEIVHGDYLTVTSDVAEGDFVYFDPPYAPASRTANFTAYAKDGFDLDDQKALRDELKRLRKKRVAAMLSNTLCDVTRELYAGFECDDVSIRRSINSNPQGRGAVAELVVTTYRLRTSLARARARARARVLTGLRLAARGRSRYAMRGDA